MKKTYFIIILLTLLFPFLSEGSSPIKLKHEGELNILVFTNNNRTLPFTNEIFSILTTELEKKTSLTVNLQLQTMDFSDLNKNEILQMKNLIRDKHYKNTDIIVVRNLTPIVIDFISAFDNIPVFVLANQMNSFKIKGDIKDYEYFRGFNVDIKPTLDAAIQCCFGTKEFVIISGISPIDMLWYKSALSLGKEYKNVKIINWHNLTIKEIKKRIAKLPKNTVVIFESITQDNKGRLYISKDVLSEISKYSSVPIFGIVNTYLNGSIVGGYIHSAYNDGIIGANVINKWLNNEKIKTPVIDSDFGKYMFDWKELKRWNIKMRNLPKNSIIINRPDSFVQRNWDIIYYIIIVVIILSIVLFVILLKSRREINLKREYELKLEEKNKKLRNANKNVLIEKDRAEKANNLKDKFMHNMSHEIRTPMNGIIGFSDMLDNPLIDEERRKNYISIIKNSSYQLLHIIDNILEISSLETKQTPVFEESVYLNYLINELFSVFEIRAKEKNIGFYMKKELSDKNSLILTDKRKLNKILFNMLENALKYTENGFVEFGYNIKNTKLVFYIKDTGVGILPKNYKTIFDLFSQEEKDLSTSIEGLGLGLSIANENTKLLRGKISLKSEKEKGTTFFITIPYKPVKMKIKSEHEEDMQEKNTEIKKNNKCTILIAEDEEINLFYLKILINKLFDYSPNVLVAKNGEDAVKICRKNYIDLILMDIKMPIMDGIEATKTIRTFNTDVIIIAQTAYFTSSDKNTALKSGCDDFISKPIDKDDFTRLMKKYIK